jgi:two-component system, cell cycle sensor histidine kinase and response regulator CckA
MPTEITPLKKVLAETHPGSVSATILLVEDDSSVRELVTRLLTMQGYKVLVAETGRAALPIWEEHKRDIDVLLTDVVMPQGIGGRELASRCQADKSHLQIIYTSGYNVELSTQSGWLRDGIQFVQKPYRPEQLLQAVRTAVSQTQNH